MEQHEIQRIKEVGKQKFSWRIIGENFVFKDGEHYYKMPGIVGKNIFYKKNDSYKQAIKNFEMIKTYFSKIVKIADTEIIQDNDGHYIIKQKEIAGEKLTKKMLEENHHLLMKFKKLVIINEVMWEKEGFCLDILGSDFIYDMRVIPNIFTDGSHLYLFDIGLLERKPERKIFEFISKIARFLQDIIIKKGFFKE
ncbi:hypothetical protein HGA92_02595 [Candidatus Gracilibacteria bacterium]|nr:hypothetical protein [Candidatus Gracilibacteria bacterium]NUJ99339.1 hypothetical protein [Candidatus Gracilibacteria bacterium]